MNRNQWIAVAVGLVVVAFFLFGNQIMSLFSGNQQMNTPVNPSSTGGVTKEDVAVGTGDIAAVGDMITVNYVGTLTDGKVFDSSLDRHKPYTFQLGVGTVIRGWDEGLQGMRVGGKRRLTISPDFGYGSQDYGPIPANSTLIFDVELLDVKRPTQ